MIKKATNEDIDEIITIYDKMLTLEEAGKLRTGWLRGVYPTRSTATDALVRGDLFICRQKDKLAATAIINHRQMESYSMGNWKVRASGNEIMVLHTLAVDPDCFGMGIGSYFVDFYEQYAQKFACKDLRIDTQVKNQTARKFYLNLGYFEIGTVSCEFNGIKRVDLVLLEKPLLK